MAQKKDTPIQRRFSLEGDFMNYKTNDLLYGFMRGLSTARTFYEDGKQITREYLPIKTFKKNKKLIASICNVSTRQIDNQLNKLTEAGLLDEGIERIEINGTQYDYPCFWFPYNYDENYELIDINVVRYLVNTRNSQAIRVYIYLLNKYKWKKDYIFTIRELKQALGYAESTITAIGMIRDILASFRKEGIIQFTKIYEAKEVGGLADYKTIPVERMKLDFVAQHKADLPIF